MSNLKRIFGDIGEDCAVKYLKMNKYKIICRNFRKLVGEIDIIAETKEYLVFVEVKTRQQNSLTKPYEAVDYRKQQRIIKTAYIYLEEHHTEKFCRFDVCEVYLDKNNNKLISINYIEDAFQEDDCF